MYWFITAKITEIKYAIIGIPKRAIVETRDGGKKEGNKPTIAKEMKATISAKKTENIRVFCIFSIVSTIQSNKNGNNYTNQRIKYLE